MRIIQKALTFDDVLLVPAYSNVLPRDVSLRTQLTRNISLNIPLLSAAMDSVTESRLAIALAQEGGIGIVHKNMSAYAQAAEVAALSAYSRAKNALDQATGATLEVNNISFEEARRGQVARPPSSLPVIDSGSGSGK